MADSDDFPTRIHKSSSAAIDSIFFDYTRINPFKIATLINGLSDHDTRHLILSSVFTMDRGVSIAYRTYLITKDLILTFLDTLSSESWKNLYEHVEINKTFNLFLNTFLSIFETCFPIPATTLKSINNGWITKGIRISCRHKNSLCILSRKSNSPLLTIFYLQYSNILKKVIREAEKIL